MNEKIKNAWEWIKEHKYDIIIAADVAVMFLGGVVLCKRYSKGIGLGKAVTSGGSHWPEKLNVSDIGVGKLDDVMRYPNGTVELWLDDIPLKDMGTLGDAIVAQIPDISGDRNVWALLSVKPNEVA